MNPLRPLLPHLRGSLKSPLPSLMAIAHHAGVLCKPPLHRLPVRSRVAWIVLTVLTAAWVADRSRHDDAVAPENIAAVDPFVPEVGVAASIPYFAQSYINPPGHTASSHCSVLCSLPSGDLLAVWYGGSREGAADVAVYTSRLKKGAPTWTPPVVAVDRVMAQNELDRYIKKVGNAVIFPDRLGKLWMVYVTVSVGGWSGCSLNLKISDDDGHTWGKSRRLTLNPFLNLSSLVRNKPIYASDGRIGLPVYHEMAVKYPQILWLTPGANGGVQDYRMRSLPEKPGLIQPTLVALDDDRVLMMMRDVGAQRKLRTAFSNDNGWTWSATGESGLPNPDSAVDALRLRDGRILLAYNDAARGRENLRLAISSDDGVTWTPGATLERADNLEFSYPYLAEDSYGRIHLTYTWQRKRIKHLEFNLAWLDGNARSIDAAVSQ